MKKQTNKVVIKYGVITFLSLAAVLGLCFLFLSIFMPRLVADFTYNLGLKNISLCYYEKTYNNSKDINDLYNVVMLSINTENSHKIITYYELLSEQNRYDEFIEFINENNIKKSNKIIIQSTMLNEDDFLKNRYISALIKTNDYEKAITKAVNYFENYQEYELTDIGVYAFTNFFNNNIFNIEIIKNTFTNNCYNTDDALINHIVHYYNNVSEQFNNLTVDTVQTDYVYYIALQSRINKIGNDLIFFNSQTLPDSDLNTEQINNLLINVNEKIRDIIFN